MEKQNIPPISEITNNDSKFERTFRRIAWILAASIFLLAATRFVEIFYKFSSKNYISRNNSAGQDSVNFSPVNYKLAHLEDEILQTRSEIKEMSERAIEASALS